MNDHANVIIRASAGTGKTFQLTNRYLSLAHADAPIDEILASTFTRKAAAEILDRVIVRLAKAALDRDAREDLAKNLGGPTLTEDECRQLLTEMIQQLHRLRVGTLDSFFVQLAGSFSLEIGLPPGWRIIDELEDAQLRSEAIAEVLHDRESGDISRLMNLVAQGAADRSVSQAVRETVNNLYGLYLAAPADAWTTITPPPALSTDALDETIRELRDLDLHATEHLANARDKDVRAAQANDWLNFISKGLARKVRQGQTTYAQTPIPEAALVLYRKLVGHARAVFMRRLAHQTEATYKLLDRFAKVYRQIKFDARAARFDDLTRILAQADITDRTDLIGFRLDTQISHLLLDEFQDTSLAQWQVIRPLARRIAEKSAGQQSFIWSGHSSLFCVGDEKQAIYGWRGGVAEILDAVEEDLPGMSREALNQSFRSSPPVIDAVNQIFGNLTSHPDLGSLASAVSDWQAKFIQHTTAKQELPGYVELVTPPANETHESNSTLHYAAQRVAEIVQQAPAATVGVLVRRNAVVAEMIYLLRRLRVMASEEGGNPLTDSAAVQTILSLLKMADHPGDTAARMHVAQSPLGPFISLTDASDNRIALRVASNVRREVQTLGFGKAIARWVECLVSACNMRDYKRLLQLIDLAQAYQPRAGVRTDPFVRLVQETRVADPTTANVRVMTIHQAKGLQFDVVVLPEMGAQLVGKPPPVVIGRPRPTAPIERICLYRNAQIQSLLPNDLQQLYQTSTDEAVTEALCVLYVAVTRAVHALHMFVAPSGNPPYKTFAGLLRATLAPEQPAEGGQVLYQHGDPDWFAKPHAPKLPASEKTRGTPMAPRVRLADMKQRTSGLQRTSPSGRARGKRVTVTDLLRRDNVEALARGSLIHAWFELLEWSDDGLPSDDELMQAADTLALDIDVKSVMQQFKEMLSNKEISRLLSRGQYQPPRDPTMNGVLPTIHQESKLSLKVHTERGFAILDDGQILNGSIDRLVLMCDGTTPVAADIIDFKTDEILDGRAESFDDKVKYYRPQMEAYRSAVAKVHGLSPKNIAARLVFVGHGITRHV